MERIKALNREVDEDEPIDEIPTSETIIEVIKCVQFQGNSMTKLTILFQWAK